MRPNLDIETVLLTKILKWRKRKQKSCQGG